VALSYAYDDGVSIFEYDPSADVAETFADAAAHLMESLDIDQGVSADV
jgi:cellulose biosynthesis protein BcsQ